MFDNFINNYENLWISFMLKFIWCFTFYLTVQLFPLSIIFILKRMLPNNLATHPKCGIYMIMMEINSFFTTLFVRSFSTWLYDFLWFSRSLDTFFWFICSWFLGCFWFSRRFSFRSWCFSCFLLAFDCLAAGAGAGVVATGAGAEVDVGLADLVLGALMGLAFEADLDDYVCR